MALLPMKHMQLLAEEHGFEVFLVVGAPRDSPLVEQERKDACNQDVGHDP